MGGWESVEFSANFVVFLDKLLARNNFKFQTNRINSL
jgi:hypothetical protein